MYISIMYALFSRPYLKVATRVYLPHSHSGLLLFNYCMLLLIVNREFNLNLVMMS
jgi:hypothetical protein